MINNGKKTIALPSRKVKDMAQFLLDAKAFLQKTKSTTLEKTPRPWHQVIFNGLQIKGIYGREMYETWYMMSSMIESGLDVSPIITHHFHYTDFEKGFEVMRSGNSGKVVLSWED